MLIREIESKEMIGEHQILRVGGTKAIRGVLELTQVQEAGNHIGDRR